MTKAEIRKARKAARVAHQPLTGELALETSEHDPFDFTESTAGYEARNRWAERYDDLNGAPEGDWDR